jgi:hypothetical protein
MVRKLKLKDLESRARTMTREALKAYQLPPDIRDQLTLGTFMEGDMIVFELYVPGERPQDARVISRATLNSTTGIGEVEVFLPRRRPKEPSTG